MTSLPPLLSVPGVLLRPPESAGGISSHAPARTSKSELSRRNLSGSSTFLRCRFESQRRRLSSDGAAQTETKKRQRASGFVGPAAECACMADMWMCRRLRVRPCSCMSKVSYKCTCPLACMHAPVCTPIRF